MSASNHHRDHGLKDFLDVLDKQVAKHKPFAVFLVVIENLPMLNSAYGHLGADNIIAKLCDKIGTENKDIYRIADNQIAILEAESTGKKNIATEKSLKNLISQFGLKKDNDNAAHISSRISSVDFDGDKKLTAEEIFTSVCAKANSQNLLEEKTADSSAKQSRAEMMLANQIYSALQSDNLQLAFQPIIEAKTGRLHSHECLLRIVTEDGKSSSAGSFIHIAEKMGIIENIDLRVLDMVLDKLEEDRNIKLSFNISNMTIGNAAWSKRFFERANAQIAKRLTIEITETAAMLDLPRTAYFMATLQEIGAQVALDDFGSGYTSFRQIRSLSLDYVKIDGSLIHDIVTNHHNQLLVKSLLEFLKGLKLKTVAEFVDGGDTAKFLIDAGIDYMQGNYFGSAEFKLAQTA